MLDGAYVQCFAALLYCLVFLFLWRQSGVVYFGFWSLAWGVESVAWLFTLFARITGSSRWLAPHSFLEFGFALSLVAAARVGTGERVGRMWRSALRFLYFFPAFVLIFELVGWERENAHGALRALVLSAIYFYSFRQFSFGAKRLFHFTLLALSLLYLQNVFAYFYIMRQGSLAAAGLTYMNYVGFYELALKTLLAFSAMAMWIENQNDRVEQIGNEIDRFRRESAREANLDYLTGLLNQASLRRRMDAGETFQGVAVVCDLDNFKSINDRFGHIVGDEVLRNVGNLLRSSIRASDEAYRWGGDEFAILFNDQGKILASNRMVEIEARLNDFRVRGYGSLQIQFSWGAAEGTGKSLRDVLERADREMYVSKRDRSTRTSARTAP